MTERVTHTFETLDQLKAWLDTFQHPDTPDAGLSEIYPIDNNLFRVIISTTTLSDGSTVCNCSFDCIN